MLHCFYKAGYHTVHHDGIEHAGYLAFLNMLALFPFLVLVAALAGFLGAGESGTQFIAELFKHLPAHIVAAIEPRIVEITSGPPQGLLTVSILGAIWTASSAVEGYRTVLNRAYHVGTPPAYLWRRLMSILQLLVFSFITLIGLLLIVTVPVLWGKLTALVSIPGTLALPALWSDYLYGFSILLLFAVVANLYYILPNIKQSMLSVVPGAALTTIGWIGAARLISYYLSSFQQVNVIYGSLGGVIAALLFFYLMNVVFIYGAEFNYLLKKALGARIVQKVVTAVQPPPDDDEE